MAKNMWKYSHLTANERMKLIRAGNADVFEKEMQKMDYLINVNKEAGLNTSGLENQKKLLVQNYSADTDSGESQNQSSSDTQTQSTSQSQNSSDNKINWSYPEVGDTPGNKLTRKYRDYERYTQGLIKDAEDSIKDLKEFYANNGNTRNSQGYRNSYDAIKNHYLYEIDGLDAVTNQQVIDARNAMKNVFRVQEGKK